MPFVIYSILRVASLVVAVILLYMAGMGGWLLWVVAVFVSLLFSYALLESPRRKASEYLAQRRARRDAGHRFTPTQEEDFADEDAQIDKFTTPPNSSPTLTAEHESRRIQKREP